MPSPPVSPARHSPVASSSLAVSASGPAAAGAADPDGPNRAHTPARRRPPPGLPLRAASASHASQLPVRQISLHEDSVPPTAHREQLTDARLAQYRAHDPLIRHLEAPQPPFRSLPPNLAIRGLINPSLRGTSERLHAIDEQVRVVIAHWAPDTGAVGAGMHAARTVANTAARRHSGNGMRLLSVEQQRDCIGVTVHRAMNAAIGEGVRGLVPQLMPQLEAVSGLPQDWLMDVARDAADATAMAAPAAYQRVRQRAMDAAFRAVNVHAPASALQATANAQAAAEVAIAATLGPASREAAAQAIHAGFSRAFGQDAISPAAIPPAGPHQAQ